MTSQVDENRSRTNQQIIDEVAAWNEDIRELRDELADLTRRVETLERSRGSGA